MDFQQSGKISSKFPRPFIGSPELVYAREFRAHKYIIMFKTGEWSEIKSSTIAKEWHLWGR